MEPVWEEWEKVLKQDQEGRQPSEAPGESAPEDKLFSEEELNQQFPDSTAEQSPTQPEAKEPSKPKPPRKKPDKFSTRKDPITKRRITRRESQWKQQDTAREQQAESESMAAGFAEDARQTEGLTMPEKMEWLRKKMGGESKAQEFEAGQAKNQGLQYDEIRRRDEDAKTKAVFEGPTPETQDPFAAPQKPPAEKIQSPSQQAGQAGKPAGQQQPEPPQESAEQKRLGEAREAVGLPRKERTPEREGNKSPVTGETLQRRGEQPSQQAARPGDSIGPAITQLAGAMREQAAKLEKVVENTGKMLEALNAIKDKISKGWE